MTRTIEGKFITREEIDELARTKNVVILNIKDDFYMCEIDRREHYTLQKEGKGYNVIDYQEVKK